MECRFGLVEHRETFRVLRPWKRAAIYDRAAERRSVAADEFCERVNYYVRAVEEWFQHHGCGHRIVDDERNASSMGDIGDGLKVYDVARRVADRLDEYTAGFVINQSTH